MRVFLLLMPERNHPMARMEMTNAPCSCAWEWESESVDHSRACDFIHLDT